MKNNNFINSLLGSLPVFSFDDHSVSSAEKSDDSSVEVTGVARYLNAKLAVTGVDKYLKSHQHDPATGVKKYMARQILSNNDKPISTGVSKYISKQVILEKEKPAVSGVARYVAKQGLKIKEKTVATGVANYLARLAKAEKENAPTTGVGEYLHAKKMLAKKAAAAELIAKYLEAETVAEREVIENKSNLQQEPKVVEELDPEATGVSYYLAKRGVENRTSVTGVAKYIAKKVSASSAAPKKTGVAKYVAKQVLINKETPTGVAKYMVKKILSAKGDDIATGVDKYVSKKDQATTEFSRVSGVAKYIARLSTLANDKKTDTEFKEVKLTVKENTADSERKDMAVELTSVEKYLAQKVKMKSEAPKPVTGVEKYLRSRR